MSDDQVNRTIYSGGYIKATDDITLDMDTYQLTVKGEVIQEGGEEPVTQEYVDEQDAGLQAQIDALTARVEALENPV